MSLLDTIDAYSKFVSIYLKDDHTLQQARAIVPVARLVQDNLEVLEGDYLRNFLPLLVNWFKSEFFSWFTTSRCENCNQDRNLTCVYTNVERLSVEKYECSDQDCPNRVFEFIRHSDPAILLVTRTGRCGEWANCFLIFLKALDYDARLILDANDHVWNEVWSQSEQRWIHVDPCENAVDTPLLYEIGWDKKLNYCIAISEYYVLDVTPRYTANFSETIPRRSLCDEVSLAKHLDQLTMTLLKDLTPECRQFILQRREDDMIQLKKLKSEPSCDLDKTKFSGRKTGSVAWRIERGEYNPIQLKSLVIKVVKEPSDIVGEAHPIFYLQYNSYKNSYESSVSDYFKKDWSSLIFISENVDYKFERDWQTAYLARYEECPSKLVGKITWRFDLSRISQLEGWKKLEIFISGKIYASTQLILTLKSFKNAIDKSLNEIPLSLDSVNIINSSQLSQDALTIDIVAELSGGDQTDETAWQKPQLFRQSHSESTHYSFYFKVY